MPSSWEVELKFEVPTEQLLLQRLAELGFEHRETELHCDIYFRHPCRNFRESDEAFRLRQLNSETYVTYKGPRQSAKVKTRPEIELGLKTEELTAWRDMLERLGFSALPPVRKQRQVFKPGATDADCAGLLVTVDHVEQLGTFAEIELVVESESLLAESQSRVEALSERLGLEHQQPRSYLTQLLEKMGVE